MEDTRSLAKRIRHRKTPSIATRHQGVVQTVDAGNTVTIKVDGGSTNISNIRYLASYTPTVGDTVEIIGHDNDLYILGKLA